ncbi:MAG: glycosyltransferase, partial [Gammaproteobacteria bacterium]
MSNRIRVLWLMKGLSLGGAENLLVSMARVADHSRFEYEVGYVLPTHDELVPELARLNVPIYCLGGRNEFDIQWIFRLRRLLVTGRYNVVQAHFPYVAG